MTSDPERLQKLLDSLGMEIVTARAGSNVGQFPILDLLGNLRDATSGVTESAELHALCSTAWERVVRIVESGKPFTQDEVAWLCELLSGLQALTGMGASQTPAPAKDAGGPVNAGGSEPAATGDQAVELNLESDAELLREFINESREHLDNIEQGVLVLEEQPDDAEMLNTVFRAFHTLKGGAGFLNLNPVNQLAHALETLLEMVRQGKLSLDRPIIELILQGRDVLKAFLDRIEGQLNSTHSAAAILIPTAALKAEVQKVIDQRGSQPVIPRSTAPAESETGSPPSGAESAIAVADEATPNTAAAERAAMVKVSTLKLDALLDLVGEMMIAQSLVAQDLTRAGNEDPQSARNMAQLGRITRELQGVSMSMRMMPLRGVFQRMARVIRDVAAKLDKQVQFVTSGEDIELDRNIVEELNDPLLHLIRNAVDHGIEPTEARRAAGKSAQGTIRMRSFHEGGSMVIEISDDGAGLNRDRILAKAIEHGLTTADASHSDEEIYGFIFAAGFSTAEAITDISGRGVGMDVVRRNIERLRGCIDISSNYGRGATFRLTLPLTLAIIDGLIAKVGAERFIIPTLSARESFRPKAEMITRIHGVAEVVNVRGRLLPLVRLYEFLGIKPTSTNVTDGLIVVVQSGTNYKCLLVDALQHRQEVVIKNLNEMMIQKSRPFAGAAILGDGRVGLILDVNSIVNPDGQSFSQAA